MFCRVCGKEILEGSAYCSHCGTKVECKDSTAATLEESEETTSVLQPETKQSEPAMQQVQENWQAMQRQQAQDNRQAMQQPMYQAYPGNGMQQQNPYELQRRYKASVAPFKIISAIANFLAMLFFGLVSLVAIGINVNDVKYAYHTEWVEGWDVYGAFGLISCLIIFVLFFLGLILPAKVGVTMNLISSLVLCIGLFTGFILSFSLLSDVRLYYGSRAWNTDATSLVVGTIVFLVISLALELISLICSIIGLTRKKLI